jgi:hypothetical protein
VSPVEILMLLFLLQTKHLIVDWLWQPEFEWKNKGTYGHWGGIRHALKNAIGTTLCFFLFVSIPLCLLVFAIDFLSHYHMDWIKMNINRIKGYTAATPQFFEWIGKDQWVHQVTYLGLVLLVL